MLILLCYMLILIVVIVRLDNDFNQCDSISEIQTYRQAENQICSKENKGT